jgi:uncharacterized phage infection (PIP) family protein YhgE
VEKATSPLVSGSQTEALIHALQDSLNNIGRTLVEKVETLNERMNDMVRKVNYIETSQNCIEQIRSSRDAATQDSKTLLTNVSSEVQRVGNDVHSSIEQLTRSMQSIVAHELRTIAENMSTMKTKGDELRRICIDNITQHLAAAAEQTIAREQQENSQRQVIVRDITSLRNDVMSGNVRLLEQLNTTVDVLRFTSNASFLHSALSAIFLDRCCVLINM